MLVPALKTKANKGTAEVDSIKGNRIHAKDGGTFSNPVLKRLRQEDLKLIAILRCPVILSPACTTWKTGTELTQDVKIRAGLSSPGSISFPDLNNYCLLSPKACSPFLSGTGIELRAENMPGILFTIERSLWLLSA